VLVFSDSQYVVKSMTSWVDGWRRRGWRTKERKRVKNQDRWEALLAAVERHESVEWEWVRGHNGHPENKLVNDLAESAAHRSVGS
jgi:ribonuclease HI